MGMAAQQRLGGAAANQGTCGKGCHQPRSWGRVGGAHLPSGPPEGLC